ncbi:MAG TPA: TIGR03936 family radical SAM-associated protein [Steroidobacteraceae bacterium]|nr:TIGR03936 family radical SAM-associated protein [Steroidobacteraceae bacterium]
MKVQRLRVTFARGAELKYITHLDLMRFWERALRRAGIAVAYSEGFSPHPQISLAAPLPVGVISSGELMDIFLSEAMAPARFLRDLGGQLPPGLSLLEAHEAPLGLPSIQSQMREAEYRVEVPPGVEAGALELKVRELLARETLPWRQQREREVRSYDLRPLIHDLRVQDTGEHLVLLMRLQADSAAAGRPDQVMAALGLESALVIERTRMILAGEEAMAEEEPIR